ncbi:MAG: serine/threonine protein kinase [Gammaproteobacteria bacterium]|nr:serine/threonine protein kinase [Gammaproteobacteria bacterium]
MSVYHENALEPGSAVAEYTIQSVLGHGGFGITYLAHDNALGANVAIKEYLPQEIATRTKHSATVIPHASRDAIKNYHWGLKNFVKEARALARFKHPNIVRVLRFIEANGTAYTVMEYEKGQTLFQHLKNSQQRLDERVLFRIIIPILNGLHEVHETGLLHLDIKPENIYLRQDGSPMLIDFGSARQAMSDGSHGTKIALTHGYAPIEQYPDKGKLGPWSDIYAIGATMYRCVTGKRPGEALDRYRAVLDYKVDPLKSAVQAGAKNCQPSLLECVDWAMQIHAKDRPQSARELQDRFVGRGRSNTSTTSTVTRDHAKSSRPSKAQYREPTRRVSLGRIGALLLLALVLGGGGWFASTQLSNAGFQFPTVPTPTPTLSPAATNETATKAASSPPLPIAASSSSVTPPIAAIAPAQPIAKAGVAQTPRKIPSTLRYVLTGHGDWIQAVAFAPIGRRLATAGNDRTIRIWEADTGSLVTTLKQTYAANAIAYSADGKTLAAASVDGVVRLWDVRTAKLRALEGIGYPLFSIAFAANGSTVAAAGKDRMVYVWDVKTGSRLHTLEGHSAEVNALAFTPNGDSLVSAGADRVIRIWNMQTGKEVNTLQGHKDAVLALAFSPDGRWLASGDSGQTIRLWDMRESKVVRTITDVHHSVLALAFGPNAAWLVAGSADNSVYLFDLETDGPVQTLNGHEGYVQAVAVSADGTLIASGGRDQSVRLWQTP